MKPLTTEPSLVEPDQPSVGYNVHYHSLVDQRPRIANDSPFETKEEAIEYAMYFFGATIEEVKPIDKRGKLTLNASFNPLTHGEKHETRKWKQVL